MLDNDDIRRELRALVSVKWLADQILIKPKNICIVDSSWHLPNSNRDAKTEFRHKHIPGAVFFDIDRCSTESSTLSHMLPSAQKFEDYVGKLGIDNNTQVILYDNSDKFAVFSAPRVWWTFRVFGHDQVSILNGGLRQWCIEGMNVDSVFPSMLHHTFHAKYQPQLVKSYKQMCTILRKKSDQVVDARSVGRFTGVEPEPREDIKPGHIPGSKNIPFMDITDPHTKLVKSREDLNELFNSNGVHLGRNMVASCGSGVTACSIALAAYICGKQDVAVYDGSWMEWYQRAKEMNKECVPPEYE